MCGVIACDAIAMPLKQKKGVRIGQLQKRKVGDEIRKGDGAHARLFSYWGLNWQNYHPRQCAEASYC